MISTLRGRSCGKHCRTKYTSVITIISSCHMHSPRKSLRINNRYLGEPESELSGVKSSLGARQPILSNLIASETGMRFSTGSIAIIPWTRCNFSQRYPRSSHSSLISSSFRDSSPHPIILPTWVETGTVKVSNFV